MSALPAGAIEGTQSGSHVAVDDGQGGVVWVQKGGAVDLGFDNSTLNLAANPEDVQSAIDEVGLLARANDAGAWWQPATDYSGPNREPFVLTVDVDGAVDSEGTALINGRTYLLHYPNDQVSPAAPTDDPARLARLAAMTAISSLGEITTPRAPFASITAAGPIVLDATTALNLLIDPAGADRDVSLSADIDVRIKLDPAAANILNVAGTTEAIYPGEVRVLARAAGTTEIF